MAHGNPSLKLNHQADGSMESDIPDNIDDESAYLPAPHKNDLDLGRHLVFRFMEEHAPGLLDQVGEPFRKKGTYSRYKDLLQRNRLHDNWHADERQATREAIARWAAEHGLTATDQSAALRVVQPERRRQATLAERTLQFIIRTPTVRPHEPNPLTHAL